jgi:hypothetical protein
MRIINYVQINLYSYYNTPQKMYVTIEHSVVGRYQKTKLVMPNYAHVTMEDEWNTQSNQ